MTLKKIHKLPRGIFAASLTPLKSSLSIDTELMLEHCHYLLQNGCDGLVIFGTTGEANSFSVRERIELLDVLLAGGLPPHKLLVGTGCCALPDSVELTQHAVKNSVGGVLVLPPFYYKNISDDGIFNAFDRLIHQVNDDRLRVYLYHFPKMSVISFSHSIIQRMVET
ncbi:dihydrodipicolinate synthase family protein, partial [candidate division KSB1 bacterium]|nr:dihydrodipicolinate synthase family protein [candidate division KSB1 bacterium]